ncbi:GNAT family N-acetyltransferase [Streptomyces sp. DSM 40750]|uniref:GNAT family N-acetyltransferase n=1 Tax=Streptomyces sp. DSM 40750 TaxID=2801030 RepID=UPI00214C5333|nr:GNAT family N-acetyltransferase [Streptomyces sp. DSM 40750]UUU22847.1 GNAT family N-acetyltransferase [Streptomyces sp. DSM 40750]
MAETEVRVLAKSDHRAAHDLARAAHHTPPISDAEWAYVGDLHEPGLALGAFLGGELVGTTRLLRSRLALPGGATVPMAAATGNGVRADRTRRGVFTRLERESLALAVEQGFSVVGSRVSEATIYRRFGHGVGNLSRAVRLYPQEARLRPEVHRGGEVRLIDGESSISLLPRVYERLGPYRPGVIGRSAAWWKAKWEPLVRSGKGPVVAVHSGPDGDDGFVVYRAMRSGDSGARVTLMVTDFHAANAEAVAGLWRFLLGVDLVEEVCVRRRPTDELVEGMLVNWRACRTHSLDDDLWLRLVDLPKALDARAYGDGDPLVLEVIDELLPANSGSFRISPDGVEPTLDQAQLSLNVDALAMVYLGTTSFATLAGIGDLRMTDGKALPNADRLFGTRTAAFCGTTF